MMNSEVTYLLNWALENKILTVFLTITFLVWLNSTRALRSYNKLIKDLKGLMEAVESVNVGNGIETHDAVETFLAAHPENTFQYYRQLFDRNVAQQIGDHRKGFGTDLLYDVLSFDNIEATHMKESSMAFYRSLLISIGVIGTFAGLIVGIGGASEGLASTDSATARLSLQELLSGAGLAFITSIAGLTFSTLFGMQHQRKLSIISTIHSRFLTALKCRIVPQGNNSNINHVRYEVENLSKIMEEKLSSLKESMEVLPQFFYMNTKLKEQNEVLSLIAEKLENNKQV